MRHQEPSQDVPEGLQLLETLREHTATVNRIAWSPDGRFLASASMDETVAIWEVDSARLHRKLFPRDGWIYCVAWSPDGSILASGSSQGTVRLWNWKTGRLLRTLKHHEERVYTLSWSPDGKMIASGSMDSTVLVWSTSSDDPRPIETITNNGYWVNALAWSPDGNMLAHAGGDGNITIHNAVTWQVLRRLSGHSSYIVGLAWAADGKLLASSSYDKTVRIWDPLVGTQKIILEGHTEFVNCVSFSADGRLLASKSNDGTVRIWRCDRWSTVAMLEEPPAGSDEPKSEKVAAFRRAFMSLWEEDLTRSWPSGLAFHPQIDRLATLGDRDSAIRIWDLHLSALFGAEPLVPSAHYRNAKVVLVGDTGVGKTALAEVLTGKPFAPTESTHGRRIWTLETQEVMTEDGTEIRETLLWDLAGQPGYRLIHQLHLGDVAVALIVFDARNETDPFAGVRHWVRALRQARSAHPTLPRTFKFLVAARTDRGSIGVSRTRINSLIRDLGFDADFETSAKEGRNIPELAQAIRANIRWEDMPQVSSTQLFQQIRAFLIQEKKGERLLSGEDDLYRAFLEAQNGQSKTDNFHTQFRGCIGRIEAAGLIRRLSFGGLVLLQPELLDAYASAILNAAKDEPDGLGSISEESVRTGNFPMPTQERITDAAREKLLLIATVEDLLRYEIALREQGQDSALLVFPSQFTRENPELPDPETKTIVFNFEGPVLNIYATLAVRLCHSGLFKKKEMCKNAAVYLARVGGICGIFLQETGEGRGELTLFFDKSASEETRFQFEEYVRAHLQRRALPDTVHRRRSFSCGECTTPVTELQVQKRCERGFDWIDCNVCGHKVSLLDGERRLSAVPSSTILEIDRAVAAQQELATAASALAGKIATQDFDVFLAYNHEDESQVEIVANKLKERGIYPWLDVEQVPPGRWFQDVIQGVVPKVKSAAIFVGSKGLGRWQTLELRAFVSRCIEMGLPVIPVLLPGVTTIPDVLPFLRELNWVRFAKRVDETEVLKRLEWGITGFHGKS